MATIRDDVQRGKLFFSLLAADEETLKSVREQLGREFSHIDASSPVIVSQDPGWYEAEMGERLFRQWVSARTLIYVPQVVEIKRSTHMIEEGLTVAGKRRINIDPGYVTSDKVVRATSRDAAHRLYLNRGIYNESVMILGSGPSFDPWPWTDPDYRTDEAQQFFQAARKLYIADEELSGDQ